MHTYCALTDLYAQNIVIFVHKILLYYRNISGLKYETIRYTDEDEFKYNPKFCSVCNKQLNDFALIEVECNNWIKNKKR